MKRKNGMLAGVAAGLILSLFIGAAVASGGQGSQQNPLVTKSYLEQTVVPDILKQVEEKVDAKAAEIKDQALAGKTSFQTVELTAGQTLTFTSGTQFLLRSGSFLSSDHPVDLTEGVTRDVWGEFPLNHLFLATGDGQSITTSAPAVVLVLGGYTVQ